MQKRQRFFSILIFIGAHIWIAQNYWEPILIMVFLLSGINIFILLNHQDPEELENKTGEFTGIKDPDERKSQGWAYNRSVARWSQQ